MFNIQDRIAESKERWIVYLNRILNGRLSKEVWKMQETLVKWTHLLWAFAYSLLEEEDILVYLYKKCMYILLLSIHCSVLNFADILC